MKAKQRWLAMAYVVALVAILLTPVVSAAPVPAEMGEGVTGPNDNGVYKEIIDVPPGSTYHFLATMSDLDDLTSDNFYVYVLMPLQNIIDQQMEGSPNSAPLEYAPTLTDITIEGLPSLAALGVAYSTYYVDFSSSKDPYSADPSIWETATLAELKGMDDITVVRFDFSDYLTAETGPTIEGRSLVRAAAAGGLAIQMSFRVPTVQQADDMTLDENRNLYQYFYAVSNTAGNITSKTSDVLPTAQIRNSNPEMGAGGLMPYLLTFAGVCTTGGFAYLQSRRKDEK